MVDANAPNKSAKTDGAANQKPLHKVLLGCDDRRMGTHAPWHNTRHKRPVQLMSG
jgi:hypothetical protein